MYLVKTAGAQVDVITDGADGGAEGDRQHQDDHQARHAGARGPLISLGGAFTIFRYLFNKQNNKMKKNQIVSE